MSEAKKTDKKAVYTVVEAGDGKKSRWRLIGVCLPNRDGSETLLLDALPVNGKLVVREWPERRERDDRSDEPF